MIEIHRMKENNEMSKDDDNKGHVGHIKNDEAVLALAASVTERACELITGGWTKGKMRGGVGGVETFCIHGAIQLAMEEVFGEYRARHAQVVQQDVEDVAVAFICDEAFGKMQSSSGGIPAAAFNDAAARKHDEVVGVMDRAADRLWALAVDAETPAWAPSKWAEVDAKSEESQQYLHASLAN